MNFDEYNTFYFDLDRNIWDTVDKYNNKIWARQIIFPIIKNSEFSFIDDCLSTITLQEDVIRFLEKLNKSNKKIGFISRGANLFIPYHEQSSFKLLSDFNILNYFTLENYLLHKTEKKYSYIKEDKFVFFDDSEEEILLMKENKQNSLCIQRNSFENWGDLI